MAKTFTEAQMLKVLLNMDQAINPNQYTTSKDLDSTDFFDAAIGQAKRLGLEEEFETAKKIRNMEV